ncbi:MAG: alpha/beta hydrolase [Clostridiales bacterium]|nr:alpha/beta hydrolase [Clostridiales bacterium]
MVCAAVNPVLIVVIVVALLFISGSVFMWFYCMKIAKKQYTNMFVRETKEKWARGNSAPENAEHTVMFNAGMKWGEENASFMTEIEVTSFDGLKMKGEYFDFGFDRAAIIMAGRAETCKYCYYFADLYQKNNFNIIVVDPRAAGLSEGLYTGAGMLESKDLEAWIGLVHEQFKIDHFVIHGICIGSVAAIYVASRHNPYVDRIVLEGPFISFYNVLCQRTRNLGKPTFPVCFQMGLLFKKIAGINIFKNKPIDAMKRVEVPMLMICGRQDKSSLPKYFDKINQASASKEKPMVWFDEGAHSHLRIRNLKAYDKAVSDFVNCGG